MNELLNGGYPHNGILFNNEKEWAVDAHGIDAHNTILPKEARPKRVHISFLL